MKNLRANKRWFYLTIILITSFSIESCWFNDKSNVSCYRIKDNQVYLRYYGGYPRAKEVMLKVKDADPNSFRFIEGSRSGACQSGHMFGKDAQHVFYRIEIIDNANPETFTPLKQGYSKDAANAFYKNKQLSNVDIKSFFAIENNRKQPYAADKYGLIYKDKRINKPIDAYSFELLPRPYSKDKNHVYYNSDFKILKDADPASFTCPEFNSIVNYQYYAFDKKMLTTMKMIA